MALVVAGAVCISATAMFIKLSGANAATAAFLRCAIALIPLVPLAIREQRRNGRLPKKLQWYAAAGGVFLGVDFSMWSASILSVGAAIATVLVNIQVIVFPLLARVIDGSPVTRRFVLATPVMLAAIVLASGTLGSSRQVEHAATGSLLGIGAGVAYAGYLYLNRKAGTASPRHVITIVCIATVAAAVTTGISGMFTTGITLALSPESWAWLAALALLGQVAAWLLLSAGSAHLPANTSATLLLLQPVLAVVFGLLLLNENPTAVQLLGCLAVVATVWYANRTPRAIQSRGRTRPRGRTQPLPAQRHGSAHSLFRMHRIPRDERTAATTRHRFARPPTRRTRQRATRDTTS